MTAVSPDNHVHRWTLAEAQAEHSRLLHGLEIKGLILNELRYRAAEWDLNAAERELLRKIERMERLISFATPPTAD